MTGAREYVEITAAQIAADNDRYIHENISGDLRNAAHPTCNCGICCAVRRLMDQYTKHNTQIWNK